MGHSAAATWTPCSATGSCGRSATTRPARTGSAPITAIQPAWPQPSLNHRRGTQPPHQQKGKSPMSEHTTTATTTAAPAGPLFTLGRIVTTPSVLALELAPAVLAG